MHRIAVLPPEVADQIAAGEVVERPASVVKELVENALDAGATSIEIVVEEGGRERIRVSDDGCGMERDDALLALERHATSKIRAASDLVGVTSFGFRGEALPSICSVARLEVETAPADGTGTRVRAAGGRIEECAPIARRRGTTITVSSLFFNAPARRKFLRGARSEWRSIVESVTSMALVRRDVRVTLSQDARTAMQLPRAESLRARVAALWGGDYAARFVEVESLVGPVHVCGLAERPADAGTAGRRTFLSVNGRAVRDLGLLRAAEAAYRSTIPSGVRPSLLLDVVLPAEDVDVNVHPAKAEVRFRDRWPIERAVEHAVRRALGTVESATALGRRFWRPESNGSPALGTEVGVDALRVAPHEREALFVMPDASIPLSPAERQAPAASAIAPAESAIRTEPVMQLRRTYLLVERDDGVLLVDQHSAHERVLYEQFVNALADGSMPSQRLLFPLSMHLGPAEADALEEALPTLRGLGFDVEAFGGHSILVHAVPTPHPRFDAERCLRDSLAAIAGDRHAGAASRHERLAATVACKAAIKAGDPLAPAERTALLDALARTVLPAHDVHGRSTIVHLTWDELERRFGRR